MYKRLQTLRSRHEILDAKIRVEELRPSPDQFQVMHLKRMKLKLRDEIDELERAVTAGFPTGNAAA